MLIFSSHGCSDKESVASLQLHGDKENSGSLQLHGDKGRPPPCNRPRCRARRLHLKQMSNRSCRLLVHLALCGWQRVAAQASRRRAHLEWCIEGASRSRAHNALHIWRHAAQQKTMALLPSRCAAAAAAALLSAPIRAILPPGWARAAAMLAVLDQEVDAASGTDDHDLDGGAAYEPFASPSTHYSPGRSTRGSPAHASPQYRPFEPTRGDEAGRQQQPVAASRRGAPPLDETVVEEVKAAVRQLAVWLNETAAWLPSSSDSRPTSLPASPPLAPNDDEGAPHAAAATVPARAATAPPSRASLAASRSTRVGTHGLSPHTLVPRPGLAPRRLQLGASNGGGGSGGDGGCEHLQQQLQQQLRQVDADAEQLQKDETMPAWLQSAADAVGLAAAADGREAPHAAALSCARRWGLENAVLLARESRQRAALRGWRELVAQGCS